MMRYCAWLKWKSRRQAASKPTAEIPERRIFNDAQRGIPIIIMSKKIKIIGAGLAGTEAAYQCAQRGLAVDLYEMRPVQSTPAHQTSNSAELVCSNSLKSESVNSAPWVLKEEMR